MVRRSRTSSYQCRQTKWDWTFSTFTVWVREFYSVSVFLDPSFTTIAATEPDWLVFVGQTTTGDRRTEAFVSSDNGKTWSSAFDTYVEKCLFAADVKFTSVERDALYCSAYHLKSGNQQLFDHAASTPSGNVLKLYKYDKLGKGGKTVLAERVVEFYVFEKFMAVAVVCLNEQCRFSAALTRPHSHQLIIGTRS